MSSPSDTAESRKRQRTVKEEPPTDESLQCHPDLCYEDGNVNLIADSTLFRVHRGMLAKFSPVLKARILMSSEADTSEPLTLHLDDDRADVEQLLYSLYDKKSTQVSQASVGLLSVWLRMGRKYRITHLEEEAMRRINQFYPPSFEDYTRIFEDDSNIPSVVEIEGELGTKECYTEHLTLALLAISLGLRRISILAMYEFSIAAPGFEDIEEALAINDKIIKMVGDPQSQAMWVRCFLGRARLETMNSDHRLSFLDGKLSQKCKTRPVCGDVMQTLIQEAHKDKMFVNGHRVLDDITDSFIQTSGKSACKHCEEFWIARHLKGRQTIWNALPSIFGVQLNDGEWEFEEIEGDDETEGNGSQNKK